MKQRKSIAALLVGLLIAGGITYFSLEQRTQNAIENRMQEQTLTQQIAWQAALNMHRNTIQTYYDHLVNQPEVWRLLELAQDPQQREAARQELITLLQPTYDYLHEHGVRQFHFHLPNNDSFIRFHQLDRWGDNLSEIRHSVKWVNQNLRPFTGFETGKVVSGFRYVYPIINPQGQHLGSVELSLPFEQIRQETHQLQPSRQFRMVIYDRGLLNQVFSEQAALYTPWSVNNQFLVEDRHASLDDSPLPISDTEQRINQFLVNYPPAQGLISQGKEGSVSFLLNHQPYSVTFTPIHDTQQRLSGFLIGYRHAPELRMAHDNFLTSIIFSSISLILIGLVAFLWLRRRELHHQQQRQLETIYATMGEGLYVTDPDGKIIHANQKACQLLGFSQTELIGQQAHRLFHIANLNQPEEPTSNPLYHAIQQGQAYEGVETLRHKMGALLSVKLVSQPLIEKGEILGAVTSFMDISREQQIADDLAEAKQKAERANQGKSEFLANMSHEIRTPLNAVIGLSELINETPLNPQQQDYINKIKQSSKLLLSIINDILDFSKIEAGKLQLAPHNFYLADMVQQINTLFQQPAHKKGLGFIVDIDPDCPPVFYGDDLRLTQVLTNLVSNAIKFTPQGEVRLSVKLLQQQTHTSTLKFSVCDTGIGLTPEQINRLFRPFMQADNSTTREYGGTGLGLVISQRLIQSMDSELIVHSQPAQGSCFEFIIELAQPKSGEQPAHHFAIQADQAWSNLRFSGQILLVEDNNINQLVASQLLKHAGFSVTLADNGQQALDLLAKDKFDAIFMDIQMPVMGGYEASEKIRQFDSDTPIIALTAAALVEDRERALNAGMNDHLSKPIEIHKLYRTLARWLGHLQQPTQTQTKPLGNAIDNEVESILPSHLPGFDLALGLKQMQNNQPLYKQLLIQFAEDLAQDQAALRQKLSLARLHAVKGVAGNLAAMRLHQAAQELETAFKQDANTLNSQATHFFHALDEVLQGLQHWLDELSQQELAAFNPKAEDGKPLLDISRLLEKLKQGDLLSMDENAQLTQWGLTHLKPSQNHALRQALISLDYLLAYKILEPTLAPRG